jgi:CRP/FNR family cyclic AMP-dependent transcriptional regulator
MPHGSIRPGRSLLDAATPALRAAMEGIAVRVTLRPGEQLFEQGDPADAFFILERGEIEISVLSPDGRKLSLDIVVPGEVLGEIGLFGGERTASATALGEAALRRMRRVDVLAQMRTRPDLALEFIEILCERLRVVSRRLEERAFLPVPARLASRLVYLADKVGSVRDGSIPVTQSELADFVGATREATAKTLGDWRSRGWIALARGSVRVLDRAALEALGDETA